MAYSFTNTGILFLLCCLTSTLALDGGQVTHEDFCYEEEYCGPQSDDWPGECKSGQRQSPIDFPFAPHLHTQYVELEFNNRYCGHEFWIVDNGHSIQVTLEPTLTSSAAVRGYDFDYPYIFAQIHFHWGYDDRAGSEHSVDRGFYPMEAHLVHYDSKYENFSAAASSGDPKALAVIGVFITEGYNWHHHDGFETIANNIPEFNPIPTHVREPIDLSTFLPKKGAHFYRYYGSLTTPGCSEVVEWTVVRDPIYVKPSLVERFREVRRSDFRRIGPNHRPTQQIGDRLVQYLTKL